MSGRGNGRGSVRARRRALPLGILAIAVVLVSALGAATAQAAPPTVSIDPTATGGYNTAEVSGTIDPKGAEGYFTFEISTDGINWSEFNYEGYLPPESGSTPVSKTIGAAPNTEFQVRLVAMVFGEEGGEFISAPPNPTFKTKPVAAPVVTIEDPTSVTGTSAVFKGHIKPGTPAGDPGAFNVEWHFECTPECPEMPYEFIPADSSKTDYPVEVVANDLKPGTSYQVTLVASNAGGATNAGPKSFAEPLLAPAILISPAHVTSTTAALTGSINPGGAEVSYHFEYGPGFAQSTPSKVVFAGIEAVPVKATVSGLTPDTTYPWRLVASNSAGGSKSPDESLTTESSIAPTCPNAEFRIGPSAALPNCRAYEMVNPPSPEYGDISRVPSVSDDGTHLSYFTQVAPNIAKSNLTFSTFVAQRTESGWSVTDSNATAGLLPPSLLFAAVSCYSTDYSKGIIETSAAFNDLDQDNGFVDVYLLEVGTGHVTWESYGQPGVPYNGTGFIEYIGGSPDLSQVVFWDRGGEVLTDEAPGGNGLYVREGKKLKLVSVLPDGKPAEEGWPTGRNCGRPAHGQNFGISADGSKVFFYPSPFPQGAIYRRDIAAEETVLVDGSQRTGEEGGPPFDGSFLAATPDGETVFYSSSTQMTNTATPGGGFYRYEIADDNLEQLTPDAHSPALGLQAGGTVSEDGSHIYFGSPRRLAPGAQRNATNLYVWSSEDTSGVPGPEGVGGGTTKFIAAITDGGIARVSRTGRYMLFNSRNSLRGATNNGKNGVYLYDDVTGELACASCRPNGTPSARDSNLADVPEALSPSYGLVPRNVDDEGRVYFNSSDKLVPADQTFSQDVYEYDNGSTYLLTAGQGDENPSYVADNSDDGSHVFFLSRSALLPQDKDAAELDLYDAHVNGGLPTPKPIPPICEGEACRTATSPQPPEAAPTTPNFIGAGNTRPKRVRPKHHHHKKHHHKKHHKRQHRSAGAVR